MSSHNWLRMFAVTGLLSVFPASARAEVPTPAVAAVPADKPGTKDRNYPFFSTDIVLSNYGYVEEEFFYDGKANSYSAPAFGSNAEIVTSGIPFRSRLLVRRPKDQSRFNGIVDAAKRSIYGMQLTCGDLCSDVRQFPSHPSSMLLAKQTAYLLIKDGDALVRIADSVTKSIAEGYTLGSDPKAKKKFEEAAAGLQSYIEMTRRLQDRGNMPPETASLLADEATTLQRLVKTLGS